MRSSAATLQNRSLQLTDSKQGNQAEHTFLFDLVTPGTIGSIRFQFCSDTPLVDMPCTQPTGLDVSGASITNQSGQIGFSIDASTDANNIILTRPAAAAAAGPVSYSFDPVQNPDTPGSYYVRIMTYASTDASGPYTDAGGLAYAINSSVDISTYVPPFLLFCSALTISGYDCLTASGDYLNFGELSSQVAKAGTMEMVLATNADTGYGVYLNGTTMSSGVNIIPAMSISDVSRPGTNQFGLNLAANSTPGVGAGVQGPGIGQPTINYGSSDFFRFVPGEQIASSPDETDFDKYTVSYIVNITNGQAPGIYVTTLEYVAMATF